MGIFYNHSLLPQPLKKMIAASLPDIRRASFDCVSGLLSMIATSLLCISRASFDIVSGLPKLIAFSPCTSSKYYPN